MTFPEITRMMLTSMDFFELRRTAARYSVPYQGVRRQKLIRDLERRILARSGSQTSQMVRPDTLAARSPEGAVSAKPNILEGNRKSVGGATRINMFSARNTAPRLGRV